MLNNNIKELVSGDGMLIHHWDTDGICSAAMFAEELHITKRVVPDIGRYWLTEKEIRLTENYKWVLIADMALPKNNILDISKNSDNVIIFDHHHQKKINQVIHINRQMPSTTWIISTYFRKWNLFSILGVVGDREEKIKMNQKIYPKINRIMKRYKIKFSDLLQMSKLLDSNYEVGDKKGVSEAVDFLLANKEDTEKILNRKKWRNNIKDFRKELNKHLSVEPVKINGIIIKRFSSKYNIISAIARKIVWGKNKTVIALNNSFFKDYTQIYVRAPTPNKNIQEIICLGRKHGYWIGGKREVVGAVIPKQYCNDFQTEILKVLKR